MDSFGFTDSFDFEKKCIGIPVFFNVFYLVVQKLKVFRFGEISTSVKIVDSSETFKTSPSKQCVFHNRYNFTKSTYYTVRDKSLAQVS